MIKYYCDRCGCELTSYEYENSCTTISTYVALKEPVRYKICGLCAAQFRKFISGEEVKRVVQIKES